MQFLNDRFKLSNNQMFWIFQFIGWLGLALLTYISLTLSFDQTTLPYVLHPFVQSLIGIVISWPMRSIFRHAWERGIAVRILIVSFTILFFSLAWNFLRLTTFIWMTGEEMDFQQELKIWYFTGVLVFICWTAVYHGFRYYRLLQAEHESLLKVANERKEEHLLREQAERLAQEAQLKMLRYQLNPHFLFNTMNAITSLVNSGRNEEACNMIHSLNLFLRDALKGDPLRQVSLREEIQSLNTYLDIEKGRFANRLEVRLHIPGDTLGFRLPSLILQPLVENVIKHVVQRSTEPIILTIQACSHETFLEIGVDNTGPLIEWQPGADMTEKGIGLRNVRDRLQNVYGDGWGLHLEPKTEGGLRVTIRIPAARETLVKEEKR